MCRIVPVIINLPKHEKGILIQIHSEASSYMDSTGLVAILALGTVRHRISDTGFPANYISPLTSEAQVFRKVFRLTRLALGTVTHRFSDTGFPTQVFWLTTLAL